MEFRWFINNDRDKSIGKSCAGERTLPMTPTMFDEMMDEKVIKDGVSVPKIEFTVEADRGFMKQLEAAATFIKGQLERGFFEVDDMINVVGGK